MADLESQLRASLPGRETAVLDFAQLCVAREQIREAIELLRKARGTVGAVLGGDRPAIAHLTESDLAASRGHLDLERALKNHPAGKGAR